MTPTERRPGQAKALDALAAVTDALANRPCGGPPDYTHAILALEDLDEGQLRALSLVASEFHGVVSQVRDRVITEGMRGAL